MNLARSSLVLLALLCVAAAVTYAVHDELQSCLEAVALAAWTGWEFWRRR